MTENKERHYCTCCGKKRYLDKLEIIIYPLLHKEAYHCHNCLASHNFAFYAGDPIYNKKKLSASADNLPGIKLTIKEVEQIYLDTELRNELIKYLYYLNTPKAMGLIQGFMEIGIINTYLTKPNLFNLVENFWVSNNK